VKKKKQKSGEATPDFFIFTFEHRFDKIESRGEEDV
jgi:hypothetical protein